MSSLIRGCAGVVCATATLTGTQVVLMEPCFDSRTGLACCSSWPSSSFSRNMFTRSSNPAPPPQHPGQHGALWTVAVPFECPIRNADEAGRPHL